ncbi:MAG: hypothetical protein ACI82S_003252, partial [Patiriisocius sp.]
NKTNWSPPLNKLMECIEDVSNNRHQPAKNGAKGINIFIIFLMTRYM